MTDLKERLRELCRDWDGSEMADNAETRTTVDCRTMREAAARIEALTYWLDTAICDYETDKGHNNNPNHWSRQARAILGGHSNGS